MDKMKAMKAYMASKRASAAIEEQVIEMQKLLYKYFDTEGANMTKTEINKVNEYLQQNMVFTNETEVFRYLTMMSHYAQSGKDTITSLRSSILAKMNNGEIVSKTDASLVSKNIIVYQKQLTMPEYDDNGLKTERVIQQKKAYCLSVDPDAEQLLTKTEFNPNMEAIVRAFEKVKTQAFPSTIRKHQL